MDYYIKYYPKNIQYRRFIKLFCCVLLSFYFCSTFVNASGGYDNGTATGKGKLGFDLTWNPNNYFPEGQSYIVLSYGFTDKFNFHSYYSDPANGSDNYYLGLFYQFYKNIYLDLATAVGIRKYRKISDRHLFAPQLLYTFYPFRSLRIGGSLVALRDIDRNNKLIGTTVDIAISIPIYIPEKLTGRINSISFSIGAFRPVLWKPERGYWHPTYSIDFTFKI